MREEKTISRGLVILMSIAAGVSVANLCYVQPLLYEITKEFNIAIESVGIVAMLVQVGYAMGLFLLVPAGDILRRKKFISIMFILVAIMLFMCGISTNIYMFSLFGFLVGFTTIVPQIILPFAASLASCEKRGEVIGVVLGGVFTGLLVSRTFSGVIGESLGWRWVYFIAAIIMVLFAFIMNYFLPNIKPTVNMKYRDVIITTIKIARNEKILRRSAVVGALMFGAFSMFWSSIVFWFESDAFNLGAREAGMLGLLGILGAIIAPRVGKLCDKIGANYLIILSIIIGIIGYAITGFFGGSLIGIIIGVSVLDVATQAGQVSNQSSINTLDESKRSRVNSIFMVCYFIGGSLGSFVSTYIYYYFSWSGVCTLGVLLEILALVIYMFLNRSSDNK